MRPVTVTVDVRGIPTADPASLIAAARQEGKVSIVIRNQPHGSVQVKQIIPLQRRIVSLAPDGRVLTAPIPTKRSSAPWMPVLCSRARADAAPMAWSLVTRASRWGPPSNSKVGCSG
jgi:hypothetical protein